VRINTFACRDARVRMHKVHYNGCRLTGFKMPQNSVFQACLPFVQNFRRCFNVLTAAISETSIKDSGILLSIRNDLSHPTALIYHHSPITQVDENQTGTAPSLREVQKHFLRDEVEMEGSTKDCCSCLGCPTTRWFVSGADISPLAGRRPISHPPARKNREKPSPE